MKSLGYPAVVAAVMLSISAFPVEATPVSVTGGFISFTGVSGGDGTTTSGGCDPFLQGIVAGITVVAPTCSGPSGLWGPAAVTFGSPLTVVDFYETQGDDPDLSLRPMLRPNRVSFTPAPAQEVTSAGQEFLLGTIFFANGIWFGSGNESSFRLQLTTEVAGDPSSPLAGHTLEDDLVMTVTSNGLSTPELRADFVSFRNFSALGNLSAYEFVDFPTNYTVTAELYGKIGSLTPTRFANVQDGFLAPAGPTAVPEPATLPVIAAALGFMAVRWRRRPRRNN